MENNEGQPEANATNNGENGGEIEEKRKELEVAEFMWGIQQKLV